MKNPRGDWAFSEEEVIRERAMAREKFLSDQATREELAWLEGEEEGRKKSEKKAK